MTAKCENIYKLESKIYKHLEKKQEYDSQTRNIESIIDVKKNKHL